MTCCIQKPILSEELDKDNWVYKPWGAYLSHFLTDDKSVCFKTLIINSGHQLSLQYHQQRSEFWYIHDESAVYQLTVGDNTEILRGRRTITIPIGEKHTILNMSSIPLNISETQYGYCEESDIVRIYDPYADQRGNEQN